jgi:hypothetical protein
VAQWLATLGGVDIHANNDEAFRVSCLYDHMETARWLVTVYTMPTSHTSLNVQRLRRWSTARAAWCSGLW